MGLLMNHLGVDGKGRVVFDAGDAGVEEEDEEAQLEEDELIDLTKLRGQLSRSPLCLADTFSLYADVGQDNGAGDLRHTLFIPLFF